MDMDTLNENGERGFGHTLQTTLLCVGWVARWNMMMKSVVRIVLEEIHCGRILVCNLILQTFEEQFLEGILVLTMLWHFLQLEVVGG